MPGRSEFTTWCAQLPTIAAMSTEIASLREQKRLARRAAANAERKDGTHAETKKSKRDIVQRLSEQIRIAQRCKRIAWKKIYKRTKKLCARLDGLEPADLLAIVACFFPARIACERRCVETCVCNAMK